MPYCYNCGCQIKEEDKFCTSCSYPIQTQITATTEVLFTQENKANGFKKQVYEAIKITKDMITDPIESIKNCAHEISIKTSVIIAVLMCALNGTFLMWTAKIIEGYFKAKLSKNRLSQQGSINEFQYISNIFNFTYKKIFFGGFSLTAAIIILTSLLTYLLCKYLFKSKLKASSIWKIVISSYIPLCIGSFLAICIGYISLKFMAALLFAAVITTIICLYKGTKHEAELRDNTALITVLLQGVLPMVIVNYFIQKVLSTWFNNLAANSILQSLYFVLFNTNY